MSADATENAEPVTLEGDDADGYARQVAPQQRQKPSAAMWFGLGFLVVVALAVVFVLPSVVSEYELPLERRIEEATQPVASAPSIGGRISPFEEAGNVHQAQASSGCSGGTAGKAGSAGFPGSGVWGKRTMTQRWKPHPSAMSITGRKILSLPSALTVKVMMRWQASGADTEVLAQILIDGDNALLMELAQDRYTLALVLDPDSEAAQIGLGRARTLDQVQLLIQQAEELREIAISKPPEPYYKKL